MRKLSAFLIFPVLFLLCALASATEVATGPALARQAENAAGISSHEGRPDFAQCIELALTHSPFIAGSSLEIKVRRLDESDSRFGLFPTVSLRTSYYLSRPNNQNDPSQPYSIEFVTDAYNPVESYFSLQARKLITQMAVLGHIQTISDFIHRLALVFLELDALNHVMAFQDQIVLLAQQKNEFVSNLLNSGNASSLELRMAAHELELAQHEYERLADSKHTLKAGLISLLGVQDSLDLTPDTDNASAQVLKVFDPEGITVSEVQSNSIELRIQSLKQELQKQHITLAYAKYLPTFFFRLESGDPLYLNGQGDLYFSTGIEIPLWDGLLRYHNIERQKIILKQFAAEEARKDIDLTTRWNTDLDKFKNASADLRLARTHEELAGLKEMRSEIGYQAGNVPFQGFLADRQTHLEAQKSIAIKALEKDKAMLSLRHLSGDLHKAYVEPSQF
jgi:outer membrane protein TolC